MVVRDGLTFSEAVTDIKPDVDRMELDSNLVIGYGMRDMDISHLDIVKEDVDRLVTNLERFGDGLNCGILPVPPQSSGTRIKKANAINKILWQRCSNSRVSFIKCDLSHNDLSRDGMHLNARGKERIAGVITNFVNFPAMIACI